jgi:hypothetical protein
MKFLRITVKHTQFDHKMNQDMKELKIQPVLEKINNYKQMDITCLQTGQISTPAHYYEIPTSRKEGPRIPTEDFWTVILISE